MALPVFRAAGAKAAGTGAVTPALPAGMSANDICILVATTITAGTLSITANGSISAWTLIGSADSGDEIVSVWWGRFSSGSTGPTVTPGGDHCCSGIAAYSGCIITGSPINNSTALIDSVSNTSFSFASGISTTELNCLCLCGGSDGASSNTGQFTTMTNTSLTSLAARLNFNTNSGGGGGFALDEGARVASGSIGTWVSTLTTGSKKSTVIFALRPPESYAVATFDKGIIHLTHIFLFPNIVSV